MSFEKKTSEEFARKVLTALPSTNKVGRFLLTVISDCQPIVQRFNVKRNMPLVRLKQFHNAKLSEDMQTYYTTYLLFEGKHVNDSDTVDTLGMKEGDYIDAFHKDWKRAKMHFMLHYQKLIKKKNSRLSKYLDVYNTSIYPLHSILPVLPEILPAISETLPKESKGSPGTSSSTTCVMLSEALPKVSLGMSLKATDPNTMVTCSLKRKHEESQGMEMQMLKKGFNYATSETLKLEPNNGVNHSNVKTPQEERLMEKIIPKTYVVKFVSNLADNITYHIKPTSCMGIVKTKFLKAINKKNDFLVYFLFNGHYVDDEDTPISLKMEPEDTIQVFTVDDWRRENLHIFNSNGNSVVDLQSIASNDRVLIKINLQRRGCKQYMYEMSYKCSMYQLKLFHLNTLPKNIRKTHTIGFLYKNKLVYKEDTPRSLGIKSDDFIEVFLVKKKDKGNTDCGMPSMNICKGKRKCYINALPQ